MSLLVAEVNEDEADVTVRDALIERLEEHDHDHRVVGRFAVSNPKHGEPDEDPRTYFVQVVVVEGEDVVAACRTCTCKGFKYHKTPDMGALEDVDGEQLERVIASVGECKHVEEVRKGERSIEARAPNQVGLDELLGF